MMTWKQIPPNNLEKFAHYILSKEGFHNRVWFGKDGSNRSRGIVNYTYEVIGLSV